MKLYFPSALLGAIFGLAAEAIGQYQRTWTATYDGPDSFDEAVVDLAVDASRNVYAVTTSRSNESLDDIVLLSYDVAGTTRWVRRYDDPVAIMNIARAVAIDPAGNIIVTGYSYGSSICSITMVKYASTGDLLWDRSFPVGGIRTTPSSAIAIDSDGNAFVTGAFEAGAGNADILTLKYDPDGNLLWDRRFVDCIGKSEGVRVRMSPTDEPIIGGLCCPTSGGVAFEILSYSAAGTLLWSRSYSFPDGQFRDIAINAAGHSVAVGATFEPRPTTSATLLAHDATGAPLWDSVWPGHGSTDGPYAVTFDGAGNVLVAGESNSASAVREATLVKLDTAGSLLWSRTFVPPGAQGSAAGRIVVDPVGIIFMSGTAIYADSFIDGFIVSYGADGSLRWFSRLDPTEQFRGGIWNLRMDADERLLAAGLWSPPLSRTDAVVVSYVPTCEVSGVVSSPLTITKSGSGLDFVFEDTGAANYDIYVSTNPDTHPFLAAAPFGRHDCGVPVTSDVGNRLLIQSYDPGFSSAAILFFLVTGDSGPGTECPLGHDSLEMVRAVESSCAN